MKKLPNNIKREGFKIPDNYFEEFQHKLNDQITKEDKNVIPLRSNKLKYVMYIAASVLLLISLTLSVNHNSTKGTNVTLVSDTINTVKETIQIDFLGYDDDDELLALFVEDEYIDEYLDEYLIEGVILQN